MDSYFYLSSRNLKKVPWAMLASGAASVRPVREGRQTVIRPSPLCARRLLAHQRGGCAMRLHLIADDDLKTKAAMGSLFIGGNFPHVGAISVLEEWRRPIGITLKFAQRANSFGLSAIVRISGSAPTFRRQTLRPGGGNTGIFTCTRVRARGWRERSILTPFSDPSPHRWLDRLRPH
jgi:hypothetical protein